MRLDDGRKTTVHVARHDAEATRVRVALVRGQTLSSWCLAHGIREALVGGFFTRPACEPLGELRTRRHPARRSVPFDEPWGSRARVRAHPRRRRCGIAARDALPARPTGDLLQAGPLLVRDGRAVYDRARRPRGLQRRLVAVRLRHHRRAPPAGRAGADRRRACSRSPATAARAPTPGLTLEEFASVLVELGAHSAINLDGGGSTSLVAGGRLRNRPYADQGIPERGGRPVATALVFEPA